MNYKLMKLTVVVALIILLPQYNYGEQIKPSIRVIPYEITLNKGMSQQFVALLGEEKGQISSRIDWRVDGAQGGTIIDHTGLLLVGIDEKSSLLIVTATFKEDISRSARAIVHVIDNKFVSK